MAIKELALVACLASTSQDVETSWGLKGTLTQSDCMVVKVVPAAKCRAIVKAFNHPGPKTRVIIPDLSAAEPVDSFACEVPQ